MNTTSILPPHPHGGGVKETVKSLEPFYNGEIVLMRSRRLSREEIKRFYDLYGSSLPTEVWWSYIGKDYNKQIEYCKDADDDTGFYMFHNKYIGRVKEALSLKSNPNEDLFGQRMFVVEWEAREGTLFPGETQTRMQEHYAENLISISKMTVMTKEEILQDVLAWALNVNNLGRKNNCITDAATTTELE
jgi:hypothetical protein